MTRDMWKTRVKYVLARPVSLVLLILSAIAATHSIGYLQNDESLQQVIRDVMEIILFPLSLLLYALSWRSFVVLNVVMLLCMLGTSIFLMVRYVDPLMGLFYVLVSLFLMLLLLRESWHNWNSSRYNKGVNTSPL